MYYIIYAFRSTSKHPLALIRGVVSSKKDLISAFGEKNPIVHQLNYNSNSYEDVYNEFVGSLIYRGCTVDDVWFEIYNVNSIDNGKDYPNRKFEKIVKKISRPYLIVAFFAGFLGFFVGRLLSIIIRVIYGI